MIYLHLQIPPAKCLVLRRIGFRILSQLYIHREMLKMSWVCCRGEFSSNCWLSRFSSAGALTKEKFSALEKLADANDSRLIAALISYREGKDIHTLLQTLDKLTTSKVSTLKLLSILTPSRTKLLLSIIKT